MNNVGAMMKSMTGYARIDTIIMGKSIYIELKSYNNRYLNFKAVLPNWLSSLEPFVREYFVPKLQRGDIEFVLRCTHTNEVDEFTVNEQLVKAYTDALKHIAHLTEQPYSPSIEYIASQSGVLVYDKAEDLEAWKQALLPVLDLVFTAFDQARSEEGMRCQRNIQQQLDTIAVSVTQIEQQYEHIESVFEQTLKQKYQDFIATTCDDTRILQEVALLLVKYTINEEVVRLHSHLETIKAEINTNTASSKRFDFICQEMNREINTISSKSISYEVSREVVIVKEAIENIREQLKNLE
ncbi:MAG: YicC family protein [Spirochaetaceae bacterium]|nr:YicC family protein [Spirochaetaceae bacterium]